MGLFCQAMRGGLALIFVSLLIACNADKPDDHFQAAPPNILVIVADDMGVNDLGIYFDGHPVTPTLDRLAESSTRFTRHYADSTCTPSRVALLTGRHPSELGFSPVNIGISPETATYPRLLQAAGYSTHHIGKWHAGSRHPLSLPMQQGYDSFYGFTDQMQLAQPDHIYQSGGRLPRYNNPWLQAGNELPSETTGHLTDLLTQRATRLIRSLEASDTPWLLNLWFFAPHTPIQPGADFAEKFPDSEEGRYLALLAQLDSNIGRVLSALEQSHQKKNTLIIFLSDNGGTEASRPSNAPYQGKKSEPTEGALRAPFFLYSPGTPPQVRTDTTVNQDIFQTIISAAGILQHSSSIGENLLATTSLGQRSLFWEADNWLTRMDFSVLSADSRWRLSNEALFDLHEDPEARSDVSAAHPGIRQKLVSDFLHWRQTARRPPLIYTRLSPSGHATLEGDSFQRSPGYQGFTVQLAFQRGTTANPVDKQTLILQDTLWQITIEKNTLHIEIPGMMLSAPVTEDSSCQELILTALYMRQAFAPEQEFAGADLYMNGQHMMQQSAQNPPLPVNGWTAPTWIGMAGPEGPRFQGWISQPVILNEYLFNDGRYGPGRAVGTLDPLCP